MAGNFYGADVAQLRQLAKELARGAGRLEQLGQQLGGSIASTTWKGSDGERFRGDWNGAHAQTLKAAAAGVRSASKALLQNADEQDRASEPGGSGSGGTASADGTSHELADRLSGMTPADRDAYLKSGEFQQWVRQSQANADAAKTVLDGLVDSGVLPTTGTGGANGYGTFLQQYWAESAMRQAGIDPNHWDPSKGVDYNRADIYKVYAFYAELYKADPRMEWIGMANQVGPTFIAGFEDIAVLRKAAAAGKDLSDQLDGVEPAHQSWITLLASLGESDLAYYEQTFLSMQKEIFSDIGSQHFAYQQGGMEEIQRMKNAEVVTPKMTTAWMNLDSVPRYAEPEGYHQLGPAQQAALHKASYSMADQEQNDVIADDYDNIRGRTSGEAFTAAMTWAGDPSIAGAKSYYEQFPAIEPYFDIKRIPLTGIDVHLGNISNREDRWALIDQDTLTAYENWLHTQQDPYGEMVKSMPDRVEVYRKVPVPVRRVVGAP